MKYTLLSTFTVCLLLLTACDQEQNPYAEEPSFNSCDPSFNDTLYNDGAFPNRKIILEDFTGQQCTNCPIASDVAKDITEMYPEDVILVALHSSGPFSEPDPENGFPLDLNTETGNKILQQFPFSAFPAGLINRSIINSQHIIGYQQWENTITSLLNDANYREKKFNMDLTIVYNSACNIVRIYPNIDAMRDLNGSFYMVGYLLENGIIGKQLDTREPTGYIENYVHNHVLRAGFPFNGDGKLIFTDPSEGDNYTATVEEESIAVEIDEDWVLSQLELVFFIRNLDSGEILAADLIPLSQ